MEDLGLRVSPYKTYKSKMKVNVKIVQDDEKSSYFTYPYLSQLSAPPGLIVWCSIICYSKGCYTDKTVLKPIKKAYVCAYMYAFLPILSKFEV